MKRTSAVLFLLLFLYSKLFAGDPVQDFVSEPLLKNANISVQFRDVVSGETLFEHRPNSLTIPASTMKMITTATALELFGPAYRFETRLSIDGVVDALGVLDGNLIIHGGGDPTLGSEKMGDPQFLTKWVEAIKAAGIRKINGRIIADESNFEQQVINPKWTWEDMGNYYAPAIHGITYLDNTFKAIFRSGRVGTTPELLTVLPEVPGLHIENHLQSTNTTSDNAYFYGAPNALFRSVFGEIPSFKPEFGVKGDIPQPGKLLALHLQRRLADSLVLVVDSALVRYESGYEGKTFFSHYSPPLSQIIAETNVKSNNLYAECVFKMITAQNGNQGSASRSVDAIRRFWQARGLQTSQLIQYDGSGLSPCNAVAASYFVDLLCYMKNTSVYAEDFYKSLAISGGYGTLSNFLKQGPLKGKIHAKSGTIERVKCYVGYMELPKRTVAFAIMLNNFSGSSKESQQAIEELLLKVSTSI